MEAAVNRQNDRILSSDLSAVPIDHKMIIKSQKPQSDMVFAAFTTDGHKSLIIFVEASTKINSDIYIEILKDKIYAWVLSIYGKGPFVFQQDGAPSHTALKTGVAHSQFSWILGQVNLAPIWFRLKRNGLLHMVHFREQGLC